MHTWNIPRVSEIDKAASQFNIYLHVKKIHSHIKTVDVAVVRMSHVALSLCRPSPASPMVRAFHRRSESCGFDSSLGLRNIFAEFAIKVE